MTSVRRSPRPGRRRVTACALALALTATSLPAADGLRGCHARRGDRVVATDGADLRLTPASVAKLFVVAASLHHLGPEHRVTTRLWRSGDDLVVAAAADPTWSARFGGADAALDRLAAQVAARGIGHLTGDLVIDPGPFRGRPAPASRATSEISFGYGAATSALAVDDNAVAVEIAPGPRVGGPAVIRPLRRGDFEHLVIDNRMLTAPATLHERGSVEALPVWGSRTIVLRGEYPISEPSYRLQLAVADGALFAGDALREALARRGVTFDGEVVVRTGGGRGELVASLESSPLGDLLAPILTDSENWLAEMLLLRLAAAVRDDGRPDAGLEIVEQFLVKVVGIAPEAFVLDDASGLSPYNLITPRAVVDLLDWARHQPWGPRLVGALARPGQGTLATWPALPAGTRAKTGTLRHTLTLAGILESRGGGPPLVFACMLGHRPDERPALRRELVDRVSAWSRATSLAAPR
ncbi:MAG: D-alanyl-D-alanine carboxypeptidase/D-alanyl-D-alanine-endopeptidase [Acidobacteriota bacterium]